MLFDKKKTNEFYLFIRIMKEFEKNNLLNRIFSS